MERAGGRGLIYMWAGRQWFWEGGFGAAAKTMGEMNSAEGAHCTPRTTEPRPRNGF
jgi:hypothetical protein